MSYRSKVSEMGSVTISQRVLNTVWTMRYGLIEKNLET